VILFPPDFANKVLQLARNAFLAWLCSLADVPAADIAGDAASSSADDAAIPQPLKPDAFEPLMASSPFTRSLGMSDSLILTGIASFDRRIVATLLDTRTMESQVVSQTPNRDGWQLVGVGGDPANRHTWTARIQVRGGAAVSVRYQTPPVKRGGTSSGGPVLGGSPGGSSSSTLSPRQEEEARVAAVNYREGFSGDGYPRQPPPEVVEKLSRLSTGEREEINRQMIGLFSRGVSTEERRRIYDDLVNRAGQGRR
jgi:hypothetical protein